MNNFTCLSNTPIAHKYAPTRLRIFSSTPICGSNVFLILVHSALAFFVDLYTLIATCSLIVSSNGVFNFAISIMLVSGSPVSISTLQIFSIFAFKPSIIWEAKLFNGVRFCNLPASASSLRALSSVVL